MAEANMVYRHVKTGGVYRVIRIARLQTAWPTIHLDDMQTMVVYENKDGMTFVRTEAEFDDGRFERAP